MTNCKSSVKAAIRPLFITMNLKAPEANMINWALKDNEVSIDDEKVLMAYFAFPRAILVSGGTNAFRNTQVSNELKQESVMTVESRG
jgi:hypothetical protein